MDRSLLREVLEEFGAVRLRPMELPEAGGAAELHLVMSFVGGAAAAGLVEHIAGKLFDRLSAGLLRFYRSRKERDATEPELTLRVSYDDVDISIGPADEAELRRLPKLAAEVHRRLSSPPLKGLPVTRIVIGMIREGQQWHEPHLWHRDEEGQRFWGISLEGHRSVTHILDTETELLGERPTAEGHPSGPASEIS